MTHFYEDSDAYTNSKASQYSEARGGHWMEETAGCKWRMLWFDVVVFQHVCSSGLVFLGVQIIVAAGPWREVTVNLQPLAFSISENFSMLSFSEKDSGSILHNAGWEHFAAQLHRVAQDSTHIHT